jgi:large subunit ribosomal protein L25
LEVIHLETHNVKAQMRQTTGKGSSRGFRREGKIPAILYGSDIESVPLTVSAYDMENLLKKVSYSQALLKLMVENGQSFEKTVMIKEIQRDPLSHKYLHIDFYEVKMDRKISATIPVVTKGTSKGVAEGGILQIIRRELEVFCFPADIPNHIEIDISDLDIGDSVHVEEIQIEGDVEIPYEANFTIVTVVSPKMVEEEEEKVEAEEGEEEGEEKAEGEEKEAPADEGE